MAKKQTKYGKIPFWAICLFGKRTKIEIAVFSYICSQLFGGTAKCPRQDIIEHIGLDKSQVSTAIKNLAFVKWISADGKDRWKVPENEPEKVDDSTTKRKRNKLTIPQQKLTIHQQKVDDSTTKVDDSTTPSYKDSELSNSSVFTDGKKRPTKREKKELTSNQKIAFNEGMDFLSKTIGKFPDGGAQGKALRWMLLQGADIANIKAGLERQIAEYQGRYRSSYTTLQKDIFRWIQEGDGEVKLKGNGTNSTNYQQQRADRAVGKFNRVEQARENARRRREAKLSGSDPSGR